MKRRRGKGTKRRTEKVAKKRMRTREKEVEIVKNGENNRK